MPDFLDELDLTSADRARLRALGASDARVLRAMARAAPAEFASYVGPVTPHLLAQLDAFIPPDDAAAVQPPLHGLGARLEPSPVILSPSGVDLALRDRIFNELQRWRVMPASPERDAAIADLEDQLNALLDGAL